jgi:hypothetical protein
LSGHFSNQIPIFFIRHSCNSLLKLFYNSRGYSPKFHSTLSQAPSFLDTVQQVVAVKNALNATNLRGPRVLRLEVSERTAAVPETVVTEREVYFRPWLHSIAICEESSRVARTTAGSSKRRAVYNEETKWNPIAKS